MPPTPMIPSPQFADALAYTAHLHAFQQRKDSPTPYIAHLLAVASLVLENQGTETEATAALLHDALEDQGPAQGGAAVLSEQIARRFGPEVLQIVEDCTDATTDPKPPWGDRKQAFIDNLQQAPESVCLVVAADKLHNTRSIEQDLREKGDAAWAIFTRPKADSLWYYRSVSDCLVRRLTQRGRWLAGELERVVRRLETVV